MKSSVIKRSVVFNGHKTSVSLEDAFWNSLKEIAHAHGMTVSKLVAEIDNARQHNNLSSAVRLFVLDQFTAHGHSWRYSRFRRSEEETKLQPVAEGVPSTCTKVLA